MGNGKEEDREKGGRERRKGWGQTAVTSMYERGCTINRCITAGSTNRGTASCIAMVTEPPRPVGRWRRREMMMMGGTKKEKRWVEKRGRKAEAERESIPALVSQ